jgi:4-amino-4-deoxy-L-arabinose transferase-like glycosyltransferase
MKAAAPTIDRVARWVAVAVCVWFAFAACWGMFGIPGGGHIDAGGAGNVMAAEQMIKWRIQYPAWAWFTGERPPPTIYICHHPFGQYYVPAALYWLFGHRDVLVHLPASLMSVCIPPLLYGIGKERWGRPIGAVAAAGYVFVPIAVGFANFWNLETICIFGALLFFWGHSRHTTTQKSRYQLASLVGLLFAVSGDWVGYLLVAPTLGWAFLRAFVLPKWATPRLRLEAYTRWWALSVTIMVVTLVWWIALFHHVGMIDEWLNAGTARGGGEASNVRSTLQATLTGRKSWIEFSFPPMVIAIGKIAAPVCLLRLIVRRLDEETYSLGILGGAVIQYVVFRQGADVHIFWPHYFAPYFALALAQLAATVGDVAGWIARRRPAWGTRERARGVAAVVGIAVGLMPVVALAHDGVRSLWVWRRTGGRYNDNGSLISSSIDVLYVLRTVVMPYTKRETRLDVHPSMGWGWEQLWTYQGESNVVGTPVINGPTSMARPFWVARAVGLGGDEQRRIVAGAHVRAYAGATGATWVVDQRERPAPIDVYSLNEREPNLWQWLFLGGTEPARSIGTAPDPWLTWEWRTHLDQPAATPTGEPHTLDELRIAHNLAVARGDDGAAATLRERIERQLDHTAATSFTSGVRLLGTRLTGGVQPRVESWFECTGPMGDLTFAVRSKVEERDPSSLIPPDPTEREMAYPPALPTKLWHPRFLYVTSAVLNHRIGHERYAGAWQTRDGSPPPRRSDGKGDTTLAVVP